MFSFADPAQELLDQFAQIRLHTGLCLERPHMSLLEELLYTREAQRLEAKTQAITLGSDVGSLRLRCADETREVSRLECFLEEAHELATTTDEFEKKKANQEKNCEVVKGKLVSGEQRERLGRYTSKCPFNALFLPTEKPSECSGGCKFRRTDR